MKLLIAGAAVGVMSMVSAAQAVPLDFVAEAAGNERGVADGTTIDFGGIGVTFSSLNPGVSFAYFDDLSGGRPAGLGVCQELLSGSGSECAVSGDDNIRSGEAVTLAFDQTVDLTGFSFTDVQHFDLNSDDENTLQIAVNDPGDLGSFTFADAASASFAGVDLIRFAFDDGGTGLQFYVNGFEATPSAIPLPAAMPLLLGALAMLGFVRRRRIAAD